MATAGRRDSERVYERQLPGGGFVAIEVTPVRNVFGRRKYHGEVIVERRILRDRRQGHAAPTVADADAATVATVFHELFPVAHSNVAVATCCLERSQLRLR